MPESKIYRLVLKSQYKNQKLNSMKLALTIAVFMLTINVFSQINQRKSDRHQPILSTKVQGRDFQKDREMIIFNTNPEMNPGSIAKPQTPGQRSLLQLIDSIYMWQLDTLINGWMVFGKYINMVYDINYNLTSRTGQNLNESAWSNSTLYTAVFDTNNNRTYSLNQSWFDSNWVNSSNYTMTYDSSNNLTSRVLQRWYYDTWVNWRKQCYTYDSNRNLIIYLSQIWTDTSWVNLTQGIYNYNINNYWTSYIAQDWNGSAWVDTYQDTCIYDINNNPILVSGQFWNGIAWENSYQDAYTYDGNNNQTSILEQIWDSTTWVNFYRGNYIYDANNNLTSYINQFWIDSVWVNVSQGDFTFDPDNFTKSETYKYWNVSGTEIEGGDSTYYYFHTVAVGMKDQILQEREIAIYPNPSHGIFTITSDKSISSLEIYNLSGERVYSGFKFSQQTSLDLSGYSKGFYIIKIDIGSKILKKKILVL